MPVFTEDTYLLGIWFTPLPRTQAPNGGDLTSFVYKNNSADSKFIISTRFRYYEGEDSSPFNDPENPLGSIDRKDWVSHESKGGESDEQLIEAMNELFKLSAKIAVSDFGEEKSFWDSLIVKGGPKQLMLSLEKTPKPWMHAKQIKHVESEGHSE